jgi:peptide-methionine (S)-S-oxide reductase
MQTTCAIIRRVCGQILQSQQVRKELISGSARALAILIASVIVLLAPARLRAQDGVAPPAPDAAANPSATAKPAQDDSKKSAKSGSLGDKGTADLEKSSTQPKLELATFGAGCFWHVEAEFERLRGVNSAVSGYAGGPIPFPSYEMVHSGTTGHAEVVMVEYDPKVITYDKLLEVFWSIHDPTSINQQGEDIGPQYRSVIFYHNESQRRAALKSYQTLTGARAFPRPIVTDLAPLKAFYRAEDYHQDYYGGKRKASARKRPSASATPGAAKTKKARAKSVPRGQSAKSAAAAVDNLPEPPSATDPFADAVEKAGRRQP